MLDFGTDKYGLNAYLFDSTDDGRTTTTGCCSRRRRTAPQAVGDLRAGRVGRREGHDRRRRPRRQHRRVPRQGRDAHAGPLPGPAVPHVGRAGDRHVADVAGRARLHRRLRRVPRRRSSRARPRPTSRCSRRASSARRPTSSRACTGRPFATPILKYIIETYQPDLALVGYPDDRRVPAPVPRPHQPDAAQRRAQPRLRRRAGERHARRPRGRARTGSSAARTRAPTASSALAQNLLRNDPTTFVVVRPRLRAAVPRDRRQQGARRPRAAVDAADLELPPRDGRDDRQGQGLLGRRHGADLPQPRRARPGRRTDSQQVAATDEASTVAAIKAAFLALDRPERLDRRRRSPRAGR